MKYFLFNKRKIFFAVLLFVTAVFVSHAESGELKKQTNGWKTNYTYVFVHGLSGWGHYDAVNKIFPYWGMKNGSLIKFLRKQGFKAFDASVAPQGSAWDRACELYAQLTGTVTDYGKEHSLRCGHSRYGKDFSKEPLIPLWNSENKINLLGHSFGGVTVRLLAHLMSEGSEAERACTEEDDISPLFTGGKADRVYSLTTLASPHNGTSAYHVPDENPEPKSRMQKAMDKVNAPKKDGRLDMDFADYDMHIQNAGEMNRWITTLKNAYYYSFACTATVKQEDGTYEPQEDIMENLFKRSSRRMGRFEGATPDGIVLGREWRENDGLVNTLSALAPDYSPKEFISVADKNTFDYKKGVWYVLPVYRGDHMSLQGGLTIKNDIRDFYLEHLNRINRLNDEFRTNP